MSKKSKQTSTSVPYTGEWKDVFYDVKDRVWQQANTPAAPYTGQLNYGTTQTQKNAIDWLGQSAQNQSVNDIANGKYLDVTTNPYIQNQAKYIGDDIAKQFGQASDQISGKFSTNGIFNSNAHKDALEETRNDAAYAQGKALNDLYGNAYNTEANRQLNAYNARQGALSDLLNAGNQEQQIGQEGLDRQYKEYLRQIGMDENDIDRLLQVAGLARAPQQTQTSSGGGGALGTLFGSVLGSGTKPWWL